MKIHIRYFASIREIMEQTEEILPIADTTRIIDVRELLLARKPQLQAILARSACAVNRSYVSADTMLHDGDELVFIPPTGGG